MATPVSPCSSLRRHALRGIRCGAVLLAILLISATGTALDAQELEVKRVLLAAGPAGCPPAPPLAPVAPEAAERAALLLAEAQQAALVGEYTTAVARLAEGALLDPSHAELAYHRARLLEETGDVDTAAGEYCRFLTLDVGADDAREVRARLQALAEAEGAAPLDAWAAEWYRHAVAYHDRGDLDAAISAFSQVIQLQPELASPYFNRAVLHLARHQRSQAAADLRAYLARAPNAADRARVAQHLALIPRPRSLSPPVMLAGGLIVPGLGQYVTRRPVPGALVTLGATGAVALALRSREAGRAAGVLGPLGNPGRDDHRQVERPFRVAGLAAAVAITTFGAVEAYLYMRQHAPATPLPVAAASDRAWYPVLEAAPDGFGVGLAVELPRR
jgi:tetratricopeptide (TPR) repeat protein